MTVSGIVHYNRVSGINGLYVGKAGAEVLVADGLRTSAELNRGAIKKATGALAAVDTAGGLFSWANPEAGDIIVEHLALVITHVATSACTADCGTTAASATTKVDNLIDGKDVNAATGTFTNLESAGTSGKSAQRLATGKWVTGSVASGASAGIVGTYEIYYMVL